MKKTTNEKAQQVIARAQAAGSTATTIPGAVKYLLTHHTLPHPLPLDGGNLMGKWCDGSRDYLAAEKIRKSDPEAKRAAHDKKFSKNWCAKLRAEEARLTRLPKTLEEIQEFFAGKVSRNNRLAQIFRLRGVAKIRGNKQPPMPEFDPKTVGCFVVSGATPDCGANARKFGLDLDAGVRWYICPGTCSMITENSFSESHKKNGKWHTDSYGVHKAIFRSCAMVSPTDPATLLVGYGPREFSVMLPVGARWSTDQHGIKAVVGPDDFHPTMPDLLAKNAAEKITAKLAANAETRRLLAAQAAVEAAEVAGVRVCSRDSLVAGNCEAGTASFAARHGLDLARHYSAPELLAMGNGDTGRVRLAVRVAVNRTRDEIVRGALGELWLPARRQTLAVA
jgi:hypothetical protein